MYAIKKLCVCQTFLAIYNHIFTLYLSLIAVQLADEDVPPLPREVIEYGKVLGIIGNGKWPKPSLDDVDLLLNQLYDKHFHGYDRVSHSLLKLEILNRSMCKQINNINYICQK